MQSLFSLSVLEGLLARQKYSEALAIVNEAVEVLAPHLHGKFPDQLETSPEEALVLAKLYLVQGSNEKCVEYALRGKSGLHQLDRLYYDAIVNLMMDVLREQKNNKENSNLREFIMELISNDEPSDSLLGYLAEIGEYGLVREKLVELAQTGADCRGIVQVLLEEHYDGVNEAIYRIGTSNPFLLYYVIDTYVTDGKDEALKALVNGLPWAKQYEACFYIEDTHRLDIQLDNDNANFILSGDWKQEIMSNFMMRNSKASFKLLEAMGRARVPYLSLCNCIMNAGTTNDTLYRNNRGIINGREWARFMEYAPIGMIHQENINAFEILKEILPSLESGGGEPGALMALGAMNARSADAETSDFLLNWLESFSEETIAGACLGLGLNLLETGDEAVFRRLKELLSVDSTLTQESAVYAIGMVFAGTGYAEASEFIRSLQAKTDFPRVKRVCGLALATMEIRCQEECFYAKSKAPGNGAGTGLFLDKSLPAHERETAVLSLGAAYVGTGSLEAVKVLLPFINDGDDDVKRAAVISLAMVAYEDQSTIDSCLIPLAQNHNMHVRAAAALVLGFFACGQGSAEIANLLEALLYDSEELVRQSAAMGAGFALVQTNPVLIPNYKRIMERLNHFIISKNESQAVKIGAGIGRSIAEVGGRSAIFTITNFTRNIEVKRVVGALYFFYSWYWYPLMSCLSLCLLPTPIFFFNQNLDETSHGLKADPLYYDYIVRIPESRRSRKFKASREAGGRDQVIEAPEELVSGSRMVDMERASHGFDSPVIFKDE